MEIVNKLEAIKYMLNNKSYVPELSTNKQDAWLLYYLRKKKGKDKDEAYKIWLPIYETAHEKSSEGEYLGVFWNKWKTSASTVRLNKQNIATIYQEEIDRINKCDVKATWQKQLLLLILVYAKMTNNFRLSEINLGLFAKYIGKKTKDITESLSYSMTQEAIKNEIFEMIEVKEWDDIEGCWETSRYFNIHEFKNGDVVCKIWNGYQVKELEYLFPIIKTCENCGSEFRPSSRGKTCLCERCYRQDYKNRNARAAFVYRHKEIPSPL